MTSYRPIQHPVTVYRTMVLALSLLVCVLPIGSAGLVAPHGLLRRASQVNALPQKATANDLRWQPSLDFDTDGCYQASAIDSSGSISEGQEIGGSDDACRDHDLSNSNTYSRQRCNNGWCAYLYDYYFEVDNGRPNGHKNDWEHIVVWVKDNRVEYVAASAHGGYGIQPRANVRFDGEHPKVVYHKDGAFTHAFRFAAAADDAIENNKGVWWRAPLVSYLGMAQNLRDLLFAYNFGSATIAFKDSEFGKNLEKAIPVTCVTVCSGTGGTVCNDRCTPNFTFDYNADDGSPGDPNPTPTPTPTPPASLKVMIVGDSISHGIEGDFTWRYRIAQWFKDSAFSANVDFVGPYVGTQPPHAPVAPQPPPLVGETVPNDDYRTSGDYARGIAFDSAHFSIWGFNDMGWFISDATGTLASMNEFVTNARKANPTITILIGNVPHRTRIGGREDLIAKTNDYNSRLPGEVAKWNTAQSRIEVVEINKAYSCTPDGGCPAGYDGLHPDARGEYEIAAAFSKVLNSVFKYGTGPLQIPSTFPQRDLSVPGNLKAEGAPMGVKVTWDPIFGARGYKVRQRVKGSSAWEEVLVNAPRQDTTFTAAGIEWEYQVGTWGGDNTPVTYSGIFGAISRRDTAPGPQNIKTTPTSAGFDVTWSPPTGSWDVQRYQIIFWDLEPGAFIGGTGHAPSARSYSMTGLTPGHRYRVFMETWIKINGEWAGGIPNGGRPIKVGAGTPLAPSNLVAKNTDATTVQLTWNAPSTPGGGYLVYIQNLRNSTDTLKTDDTNIFETNYGIAYLFPGTWNYKFCVTAVNGVYESGMSNCVVPEKYPGF